MHNVNYNLFTLKRQLELKKQRPYTWKEIGEATGIHRNTFVNLAANKTQRIDLDIAAKLLDFFSSQGMPICVGDLFTVTQEPEA